MKLQEYLERRNLPKLPIPPLEDTFARYTEHIKVIGTAEDVQRVEAEIAEFPRHLDEALRQFAYGPNRDEAWAGSWLEGLWDSAYLEQRSPLPINTNPSFLLHPDPERNTGLVT